MSLSALHTAAGYFKKFFSNFFKLKNFSFFFKFFSAYPPNVFLKTEKYSKFDYVLDVEFDVDLESAIRNKKFVKTKKLFTKNGFWRPPRVGHMSLGQIDMTFRCGTYELLYKLYVNFSIGLQVWELLTGL